MVWDDGEHKLPTAGSVKPDGQLPAGRNRPWTNHFRAEYGR